MREEPWPPFDWLSLKDPVVVGVDEVGRGCLAGPVYAAAAQLNPAEDCSAFTDSKCLSESRREILCEVIQRHHKVAVAFATVEEITEINILQASLLAMKRAVLKLGVPTAHVLVDGDQAIPNLSGFSQTTLIKGDLRATPIAAASIVAKVVRDRYMVEQAKIYPAYGFERHKGYATPDHKKAIDEFGPCTLHRPTFAGVREHLQWTFPAGNLV